MARQCEGCGGFDFSLLGPGRLDRAIAMNPMTIDQTPDVIACPYHTFECPINLVSDLSTLLIKDGPPLFESYTTTKLNDLMTNPLTALLDPELPSAIKKRIDHVLGHAAAHEMFSRSRGRPFLSPLSRESISCAIVLGDDLEHDKATDWTLAHLFFGNQLVGAPEMWLFVIWHLVREVPYLANNAPFLADFDRYMCSRMKRHMTNITLSGLAIEPLVRCPVDLAIWYCVVSPMIGANATTSDTVRNRLRSMGATSRFLTELLDLLGYKYDREWTLHQLCLYRAFAWMMNKEKENTHWRAILRAQYQNSFTLSNGTIVILDGPASANCPVLPEHLRVPLGELLALAALVDSTKKTNAVLIPNQLPTVAIPAPTKNYGYPPTLTFEEYSRVIPICPATCRPWTMDRREMRHWHEVNARIYGPLDCQLSINQYFIVFVASRGHFPTVEELVQYMAERQASRADPFNTLPAMVMEMTIAELRAYQNEFGEHFERITPDEFNRRAAASCDKTHRVEMEKTGV
jgi:hypothetical protein